jgi:hypothetical protein
MTVTIGRRELLVALGGAAAAWPLAARAQQPAMPIVGLVGPRSPEESTRLGAAFRKALNETGYIEAQNGMVEYHWLEGKYDRLPALMADLVRRRVAVIATPAFTAAAPGGESRDHDDPDRLRRRRRPGQVGPGRQFRPTERQCDRDKFFGFRSGGQATWSASRPSAQGGSDCRADQSSQCPDRRDHVTRDIRSCARPRTTNPDPQCQHQPRDRGGLRHPWCASAPMHSSSPPTVSSAAGASKL